MPYNLKINSNFHPKIGNETTYKCTNPYDPNEPKYYKLEINEEKGIADFAFVDRELELTYANRHELVQVLSELYGSTYGSAQNASR